MIGAFLMPYPVRGVGAPYLWIFYKLLSALPEQVLFLVGEDYLIEPEELATQGRWEVRSEACNRYGYVLPTPERFGRHAIELLPDALFKSLLNECGGNPIAAFRRLLTARVPAVQAQIDTVLSAVQCDGRRIECLLTWCNCPSLSAAAAARQIRVVHLEEGPLRAPDFRPTAYLDFSGVNGNTEAWKRYQTVPACNVEIDRRRLLRFFHVLSPLPECKPSGATGVALQVEDDSNLVAFGSGFDNQAAIAHAVLRYGASGRVRVRSHPGSAFQLRGGTGFDVDFAGNSIQFVCSCSRVLTINSSVGLEAFLLGIPVTTLGECSYRYILDTEDPHEAMARMAFYLFAYLVPRQLLFDLDYLRFRLSVFDETQIVARHLKVWLPSGTTALSLAGRSLWEMIDAALPTLSEC